ncbi:MAG: right-handed parallel beta-helix repeat-containing protein [Candidatus Latescibacterota bacterium]
MAAADRVLPMVPAAGALPARVACAAALLLVAMPAGAGDHYVSPSGVATWSASADSRTPCSLDTANVRAQAGDTVLLQTGTYTTGIEPAGSGRAEAEPIAYRAVGPVVVAGTRYAIHLDGVSYVSVEGVDFRDCEQFLVIRTGHHNRISHCRFEGRRGESQWMGSWVHESSTHNRIQSCVFARFGWVSGGDDKGVLLDIGYDDSTTDASDGNVVEDCAFHGGGHHLLQVCGRRNVVRRSYLHNEDWMPCGRTGGRCGNRGAMTIGPMAGQNLFEGNRFAFAGTPPDDNGADGLVLRSPGNIVRRNLCYANGAAGIALASMQVSRPEGNYVYANTLYRNGYDAEVDSFWRGGISFGNWGHGPMPGNVVINNVLHGNWSGAAITGYGEAGPQQIRDNWTEGDAPGFADDRLPEDPADASRPDLRLIAGSPCIDRGVFLTRVSGTAGEGTVLKVEDAGFFYDGWGIPGEEGDLIQLEDQTTTTRIIRVDYEESVIALATPLAWRPGQGVSLAYRGAAPDLGALEYEGLPEPMPDR